VLQRKLPSIDEASSTLRRLNLLYGVQGWSNPNTPEMLCGPFATSFQLFKDCDSDLRHKVDLVWQPIDSLNILHVFVAWRVAFLLQLIAQGGTLLLIFPSYGDKSIVTDLYACLDSMFPLLAALETVPTLTMEQIYIKRLNPECQRQFVIDHTYTDFIGLLIPYILNCVEHIPVLFYERSGCDVADSAHLNLLITLLRQLLLKREKCRVFNLNLKAALQCNSNNCTTWLIDTLVTTIKYALLGNYPGATVCASFTQRRQIYALSRENAIKFITACVPNSNKRHEQSVAYALLSTIFNATFTLNSNVYQDFSHMCKGWDSYANSHQRVLQVILDYYPSVPPANQIDDVFRMTPTLSLLYQNIFYAIHAVSKKSVEYQRWSHIRLFQTDQLTYLTAIACQIPLATLENFQKAYLATGTCNSKLLRPYQWNILGSLAAYLVDQYSFSVKSGTVALYLQQSKRMLETTNSLSPEKTSIMFCSGCDTGRFRPVGHKFPKSHITLIADFSRGDINVHCFYCNNKNLERINLLGKYIRCYLENKKNRKLVTLALCSACVHICVAGYYAHNIGVICRECAEKNKKRENIAKECAFCSNINLRSNQTVPKYTFLDEHKKLVTRYWCQRCMPPMLMTNNDAFPILNLATAQQLSHPTKFATKNRLPPKRTALPLNQCHGTKYRKFE
jgi:hypothetical protein